MAQCKAAQYSGVTTPEYRAGLLEAIVENAQECRGWECPLFALLLRITLQWSVV